MERQLYVFSNNYIAGIQQGIDIVNASVELTKEAMAFSKNKQAKTSDYMENNRKFKEALLEYAKECCPILEKTSYDVTTEDGFKEAYSRFTSFREVLLSVMQETIKRTNSKTELQQTMQFAEIRNGAEGDSANFKLDAENLITFEGVGYSNNSTRHQFMLSDNITAKPSRIEASIGCDLYQFNAGFYDWGQAMADINAGLRRYIQYKVAEMVFSDTDLTGTPFLKPTFAKDTWMELCEKLKAINGVAPIAYGTKSAFGTITDGLDAKFFYGGLGDKILTDGYISNIYGTTGFVLDQAVDPTTADFAFQLPTDKILLAAANDKFIKLFMEGSYYIQEDNGNDNSIMAKSYRIMTAVDVKKASSKQHGLQIV